MRLNKLTIRRLVAATAVLIVLVWGAKDVVPLPSSPGASPANLYLPLTIDFGHGPLPGCRVAIMPLGDSITQGYGDPQMAGYRRELFNTLTGTGYAVNLTGGRRAGLPLDFDRDNEGYPGVEAATIRDNMTAILDRNRPDIILLHVGTNGMWYKSPEAIALEIDGILSRIYAYDDDIVVFLARIINRVGPPDLEQRTSRLNELIQALADARILRGDPLVVVDMEKVLTYTAADMYDQLHPNAAGYRKMAAAWAAALQDFLPGYCRTERPLHFISAPDTAAYVAIPYRYTAEVSANPPPTFSLRQAPPGMTIDPESGQIDWSPPAAGEFTVVVAAANGARPAAEQAFVLRVAEESLCPADMSAFYHLDEATPPYSDSLGGQPALCARCPAAVPGKVGGALWFDGAAGGLAISGGDGSFDWGAGDDFSIEFWLRRPGGCAGNAVGFNEVIAGRTDPASHLAWWAGVSCQHQGRARFVLRDSDGGDSDTADVVSQTALTGGDWHHVAVVRDASTMDVQIYVDGQLEGVALANFSSGFASASAALTLGRLDLLDGFDLAGTLDELAVYDRALREKEIQQHVASGQMGKPYCQVVR